MTINETVLKKVIASSARDCVGYTNSENTSFLEAFDALRKEFSFVSEAELLEIFLDELHQFVKNEIKLNVKDEDEDAFHI